VRAIREVTGVIFPRDLQVGNIVAVDLIQRRVSGSFPVTSVPGPVRQTATREVNPAHGSEIPKKDLTDNRQNKNAEEEIPIRKKILSHVFTVCIQIEE
jgi:hypothetical protein